MSDLKEFRNILFQILNIRCVFPVTDQLLIENEEVWKAGTSSSMYTKMVNLLISRCMKERMDHPPNQKEFIEDVVARIRVFKEVEDNKVLLEVSFNKQSFAHFSLILDLYRS